MKKNAFGQLDHRKEPRMTRFEPPSSGRREFTRRERSIIDCLSRGLSNKQISLELGLTEGTARTYIARVRAKDPEHTSRYAMIRVKVRDDLSIWLGRWSDRLPADCLAELLSILSQQGLE